MEATTVNSTGPIDWAVVWEVSRRTAAAMLAGSRNAFADAEDVAQRVAGELHINVGKGFLPLNIDAVVRSMTRKRVLDNIRGRVRRQRLETTSIADLEAVGGEPPAPIATPEALAIHNAELRQAKAVLVELLRTQPKRARLAIGRTVRGETSASLARREGMSVSAIDTAVCRGLKQARVLWLASQTGRASPPPGEASRTDQLHRLAA